MRSLALVVLLAAGVGPVLADNQKILAEIAKLQNEISQNNARRQEEIAKESAKWDAKINKEKAKENAESNLIRQLRSQKASEIDKINTDYAQARMKFVDTNATLQQARANLIRERDLALVGLTGDEYRVVATKFNAMIAAINEQIVKNNADWRAAYDKKQMDIANIIAKFDKLIQKELQKDNKEQSHIDILIAEKKKEIAKINAHHDKKVAELNKKIDALRKKLK